MKLEASSCEPLKAAILAEGTAAEIKCRFRGATKAFIKVARNELKALQI